MLVLPIKIKWFDMIRSGEKKEEYRDVKPYYIKRFKNYFGLKTYGYGSIPSVFQVNNNSFKEVIFRNGYHKNSPQIHCICTLEMGEGNIEWGAEKDKKYFILRIWEVIKDD